MSYRSDISTDCAHHLENGRPTGTFRVGDGPWRRVRDALDRTQFVREASISPKEGPVVHRKLGLATDKRWGGLSRID